MIFNRRFKLALVILMPPLAFIAAIWLPFGFALSGLIEEWDVLGLFSSHGVFFIANINSPMAAHALRPLTVFPHAVAHFIDPDSFVYWHVLLLMALLVKGSASSFLIWKATDSTRWAMAMGGLIIVYPADTMQLAFRSLHINWALSLFLFASSIFVYGYCHKKKNIAVGLSFVAAIFLFLSSCMYEAALMLVPLPIFILWVRDGTRVSVTNLRARFSLVLIWAVGAFLYMMYAVVTATKVANYQASITGGSSAISVLIASFPKLFSVGALRGLFGGWYDALGMVSTEFRSYTYLVLAVLTIGFFYALVIKVCSVRNPGGLTDDPHARLLPLRLAFAGFVLMLLGYVPFLLLPSHQLISQRTFLWVSPGAAMFWISFLLMVSRQRRGLGELLTIGLLTIGLGAQLFQFNHYVQISEKQRLLLRGIVENFDGNIGDKTLIILDKSNMLGHTWMFLPGGVPNTLTYLYGKKIASVEICHSPSMEWQMSNEIARKGSCVEGSDDWEFRSPDMVGGPGYDAAPVPDVLKIDKRHAFVITINPDGSVSPNPAFSAYRQSLTASDTVVGRRYRGILERDSRAATASKMFFGEGSKANYRWDFGDWWSLELPTRGSGWREAEWQVNSFIHKSAAWKSQENSSLYFEFSPLDIPYVLRAKFETFVNVSIKDNIKVRINTHDIVFKWTASDLLEAKIQPGVLVVGVNEIQFNSPIDRNYFGLSAKLDWFDLNHQ